MSGTITVIVVSPDTRSERRFDPHISVQQLKERLELVTGVPASAQRITLHNSEDDPAIVTTLDDDARQLGFYGVRNLQVLKVEDTSPPGASLAGQFTDVSQVEKFELSEEEYASRSDTVLAYKQRNKLGRFAPAEPSAPPNPTERKVPLELGQRCEVTPLTPDGLARRAVVQFVGPTDFGNRQGIWVGVLYDEPVGQNDGSVDGKYYFLCPPMYGGFVRPERIRVGNFPQTYLDMEFDDDDEEL